MIYNWECNPVQILLFSKEKTKTSVPYLIHTSSVICYVNYIIMLKWLWIIDSAG